MSDIVVVPVMPTAPVVVVPVRPPAPVVETPSPEPTVVYPGNPGPKGVKGDTGPSGTTVVALPYDSWPPVNPQPNTLYLRLAP